MPEEINYYGLVNKPPIDEICNLDLINKPDLMHYGILKMRWGVRRYQNPDGTLTPEGKARLRSRREKFELKEAKRKAKEEKREAKAKKRLDKKLNNPDPNWINRNMHKLTNEQISKAIDRIRMKKSMEEIQKDRIAIGKNKADTIIGYGQSLNNILKFINSDAGKGIREKLGFGTETVFDFSRKEEEAKKEKERQKQFNDELKKDEIRRKRDYDDWAKKDYHRREQDLIWDNRRLDYEMQKKSLGLSGNNGKKQMKAAGQSNTPKPNGFQKKAFSDDDKRKNRRKNKRNRR